MVVYLLVDVWLPLALSCQWIFILCIERYIFLSGPHGLSQRKVDQNGPKVWIMTPSPPSRFVGQKQSCSKSHKAQFCLFSSDFQQLKIFYHISQYLDDTLLVSINVFTCLESSDGAHKNSLTKVFACDVQSQSRDWNICVQKFIQLIFRRACCQKVK